ncbi:MAG: hypothetical protein V4673_15375 [Pseudomonadota bacterium]
MGEATGSGTQDLVDPEEDICRLCFSAKIPISYDSKHPNQIDSDTGLIRLEELSWADFRKRGFSIQRRILYSLREALEMAARRDAAKTAKGLDAAYTLAGVLIAKVERINTISDAEGKQVFRVIPTPGQETDLAHAEIRIADHLTKDDLLKFRVDLQAVLGKMQEANLLDQR